ncbi:Mpo1 family 2-hydroxy fatty acid dioxygenase [Archangium lipolyticum]|uniref:Mpo1 family 2-hydroxy fatty acid dioxygenase n=1 Tax=Archangium lipolyticum TaxID=2970465 RepID=UPI00214A7AC1|nr:Mpo1-like protein [Archangium lipolyticum]
MKTLVDHLAQYAAYHRDRRNIATHFIGIPMIAVAVATLLSRTGIEVLGLWVSPALVVSLGAVLFYLRLDSRFGLTMAVLMALNLWAGQVLAAQGSTTWLSAGIGLFVVGWVFQFVGHYFEGRKPAFVDDLVGLIVGPLFVVAEVAFMLGLRSEVRQVVEARSGPTYIRSKAVA